MQKHFKIVVNKKYIVNIYILKNLPFFTCKDSIAAAIDWGLPCLECNILPLISFFTSFASVSKCSMREWVFILLFAAKKSQ